MRWTTIYIAGKPGFAEDVVKELEQSGVPFMQGTPEAEDLYIFWKDDATDLGTFKRAIGAKTVFKYRLRFFGNRDEYLKQKEVLPSDTRLGPREEALLREVNAKLRRTKTRVKTA